MDYVVCKKILECSNINEKCSELLFHFCAVNADRVVFDEYILDDYKLLENEYIRAWLNAITMNNNSYRMISCTSNLCTNNYVNVCLHTSDKILISDEKEDYDGTNTTDINIYNKLEAHMAFQAANTVNIRGNNARVTMGNNSNITESSE